MHAPIGTIRCILVVGVLRPLPSSNALMVKIPKTTNSGVWVCRGYPLRPILKRVYISWLEPSDILPLITLLINGRQIAIIRELSVNGSVQFWYCLTKPGKVDFRISPTSWIKLRPQCGTVPTIPIGYGYYVSTIPIALSIPYGLIPSTPVILTFRGVLDIHAPSDAVFVNISFVAGVRSIGCVNMISAIPGFFYGGKTGMV